MNLASKTRPGLLVGLVVIGGVLAWCVETWLVTSGRAVMAPPLTMPLTLVVLAGLLLWLVLVGSKFVVLELVAFVFRGQVYLGGFFAVTGLIILLLLARKGVRWLLDQNSADAG